MGGSLTASAPRSGLGASGRLTARRKPCEHPRGGGCLNPSAGCAERFVSAQEARARRATQPMTPRPARAMA
jgi:hypothetical protein